VIEEDGQMGVLQRKSDGTEVISVRVPTAIKAELVELRQRANATVWVSTSTPRWQKSSARPQGKSMRN
jgi:hypothetical protein